MACEPPDGAEGADPVDYVVKLKARQDRGVRSLASESIAACLGEALGIPMPSGAMIEVSTELAASVRDPEVFVAVRDSVGMNFGTRYLSGGYMAWGPATVSLSDGIRMRAAELIAFDVLLDNPDRRPTNPNLLTKGAELYALDHELAFAFEVTIGGKPGLNGPVAEQLVRDHACTPQVRGREYALDGFVGALEAMTDDTIAEIVEEAESTFSCGGLENVVIHIRAMRDSAQQLGQLVARMLR